uniref:Uncharacterized protein n=1 Tax=Tetradesmus obliquus TaxID=3088 RepID=A0A383VUQ6_TETOB
MLTALRAGVSACAYSLSRLNNLLHPVKGCICPRAVVAPQLHSKHSSSLKLPNRLPQIIQQTDLVPQPPAAGSKQWRCISKSVPAACLHF